MNQHSPINDHPRPPDMAKVRECLFEAIGHPDNWDRGVIMYGRTLDRILTALAPFLNAPAQPGTTDTERLDWLEKYMMSISRLTAPDMGGLKFVGQSFNPAKELGAAGPSYLHIKGRTLRAAIDAAMASGKKEGAS